MSVPKDKPEIDQLGPKDKQPLELVIKSPTNAASKNQTQAPINKDLI